MDRSIDADHVVACLTRSPASAAFRAYLRFDNGPEFIAYAVADWCRFNDAETIFIEPGSPWQNAWIESFNGRIRDEHLNGQLFDSLFEAQVLTEDWSDRLQRQSPAQRARLENAGRVRRGMEHRPPTSNSHNGWITYRVPVTGPAAARPRQATEGARMVG